MRIKKNLTKRIIPLKKPKNIYLWRRYKHLYLYYQYVLAMGRLDDMPRDVILESTHLVNYYS